MKQPHFEKFHLVCGQVEEENAIEGMLLLERLK